MRGRNLPKMEYPLLKELFATGFEVPREPQGGFKDVELAEGGIDHIYFPTLEELVEACGEHFTELRDLQNLQLRMAHPKEIPVNMRYEAYSSNSKRPHYGHGRTMKVAMANLFLAVNNPTFGL